MQWARGVHPEQAPPGRQPLGKHPLGRHPFDRFTPRQTPLADTPLGPLRQKPLPPRQTPPRWPLSGLYASYWNVLLLLINLTISLLLLVSQNIIKFMSQNEVGIVFSIPLTPYFIFEKKVTNVKEIHVCAETINTTFYVINLNALLFTRSWRNIFVTFAFAVEGPGFSRGGTNSKWW